MFNVRNESMELLKFQKEAVSPIIKGCYHFDLPLDVKKGIIRLVKYDLPIFQWVQ